MTTEMKKAFKLLKYSFQVKTNIGTAVFFFLLGVLFIGLSSVNPSHATSFVMGITYVALTPMYFTQLLYSTLYANMVKASPKSRLLEIQLPDILCGAGCLLSYTLLSVFLSILIAVTDGTYYPTHFLITGGVILMLQLYSSIAFKFFVLSIIGLILCIVTIFGIADFFVMPQALSFFQLNTTTGCLLGYLLVIIGMVLGSLIRRATYKYPLSKLAASEKLRKQL